MQYVRRIFTLRRSDTYWPLDIYVSFSISQVCRLHVTSSQQQLCPGQSGYAWFKTAFLVDVRPDFIVHLLWIEMCYVLIRVI